MLPAVSYVVKKWRSMNKGRIISLNGGIYTVITEDNQEISCKCQGKFRNYRVDTNSDFKANKNRLSTKQDTHNIKLSPKVGDFCYIENNMITKLLPRKNSLIRPDVSNIDQALLVFAAKEPDFSFYLLDLFLVNVTKEDIEPLIVISKIDKLTPNELLELKEALSYYETKLGYRVFYVNSKKDYPKELVECLNDKTTIVAGQTGAGKSTLINAIIPGFNLQTNEISFALGRGKHTTRVASLYQFMNGFLGDTPGFSKLDLQGITEDNLKLYFKEFNDYHCKFNDCLHLENTKGCEVRNNIGSEILESRYLNYLKMLKSLGERRWNLAYQF